MYQPGPGISDLISRFILAPHDPLLQEQIAALCNEGPGQAAFVEERLAAWLAAGTPVLVTIAAPVVPTAPIKRLRSFSRIWMAGVAAAVLIIAFIIFCCWPGQGQQLLYANNTGHIDTVLLTKGCTMITNKGTIVNYSAKFDVTPELQMLNGNAWFELSMPARVRMHLDEHTDLYTLKAVFTVHKTNTLFKVLVTKGKVTLVSDNGKKLYLTANMMAKRELHEVLQHKTVRSQSLLAWKTGKVTFRNIPLEEILDAVNSYFDLDIQVPPSAESLYKRRLTVDFEHKSADETLALLRKALKVPIAKDSANRYYITLK